MRTLCAMSFLCAGLLATVSPMRADFVSTATLLASTDNASGSSGSGTATVDYSAVNNSFSYTLSWMNLTGPATMAHIHVGAVGVSGPVVIPFFMSNMPATDTISGTLTQADVTPAGGISTIAQMAQAIESGDGYVNIHTAMYPNGELRGQLAVSSTATPEPATTGLMGLAIIGGAFVLVRRRRQSSALL